MRGWIWMMVAALGLAVAGASKAAALKGDCPDGYAVKGGLEEAFIYLMSQSKDNFAGGGA